MAEAKPISPAEMMDWGTVAMSETAQKTYQKYIRWLREDFEEAQAIPLVVLVWGPGQQAGGELFRKREEIRGRLLHRGDVALFSEELDEVCRDFSTSSRVRELFQAHRADLVVALYGSPGSIAEVHDMALALGTKMLIFVDSRHAGGYGFTGLLGELNSRFHNVSTFEFPKDLVECHLMSAVEAKLNSLRLAKWLAKKKGEQL